MFPQPEDTYGPSTLPLNLSSLKVLEEMCHALLHSVILHLVALDAKSSSSSSSSRQTPQLFSILSYLYTVHPSLTIDNTHLYFPSDASDLDAAMMIVSIPMIQLRGKKE